MILLIVLYSDRLSSKYDKINERKKIVKILARQSARWSIAAENDNNPMIAVLHSNYGAAYLWAISDIITSSEFEKYTGQDYLKFKNKITEIQDIATKRMSKICPEWAPRPSFLTFMAGDSD
jgi:hypothetical protein